MLTVKEYLLDTRRSWIVLGIHDGWKPICVRPCEHSGQIVLAALVDTEEAPDQEVVRLLAPGDDVWLASERQDSAFLGYACGRYVFLDLPAQRTERRVAHPALMDQQAAQAPPRRVGRPDLENSQD